MVAVVAREVDAYEVLESGAAGRQLRDGRRLAAQLVADHDGNQVVLGLEVRIEGAVGQAGVGHQGRDPRAVDPVLLEATTSRLDDPPPGRVLVLLAVPGHHARSWFEVASPFIRAPLPLYADRHPNYGRRATRRGGTRSPPGINYRAGEQVQLR